MQTALATLPRSPLEGLGPAAARILEGSKAPATLRAYGRAWRGFSSWCEAAGREALPATPATVGDYLAARADACRPSTLQLDVAAISKAHAMLGLPNPARSGLVRELMQGLRRRMGVRPARKAAATVDVVRRMVDALPEGPRGLRDRALLLLGFAGALRRGELVGLDVEDLEEAPEGLRLTLRRSKTDQEGAGAVVAVCRGADPSTCPVRAVEAWRLAAGLEAGPLFRPVDRHGNVSPARLTGHAVARVVKGAAEVAGLDARQLSGHSLRAGHVTQAARCGVEERDIARTTRHRSVEVLRGYVREADTFRGASSGRLGL